MYSPQPKKFKPKRQPRAIPKDVVRAVFERDNGECQYCDHKGDGVQVHHRIFKSQGGRNDPENLTLACWKCHHNHGELKNKRLKSEDDDGVILGLVERYRV